MSKKYIALFSLSAVLLFGVAVSAPRAEAASLTSAQIQAVTSLLTAFGVDSSTIATVQTALGGATVSTGTSATATSTASGSSAITANMIGYLHLGDRGSEVKYLQALLAADPSIYPEGLITGYFGALTQAALQRYQEKHGLEQVGYVGPKTLSDIQGDLDDNPLGAATSTGAGACAIVPPGHLIAPGWLKHHDGEEQIIPTCEILPPGIAWKVGGGAPSTTPDTIAPVITSVAAGGVSNTSATITWFTNEYATGRVDVGTTTSYGTSVSQGTGLSMSHSVTITGLSATTTYHFRVASVDSSGNIATSSDYTFTTLAAPDTTPPVILSVSIGSVASTSAVVSWTTNEQATSKVYFGTSTPLNLLLASNVFSAALTTSHTLPVSGLTASSTYYYVIESADAAGNTATTTEASFTTTN
ncbi:MAG: fibronectin type III domain-containing protein [Patescibacteria group bacterium]|nr:fibronectin type III domain-containing protein [Patescibacteria group bacterium]